MKMPRFLLKYTICVLLCLCVPFLSHSQEWETMLSALLDDDVEYSEDDISILEDLYNHKINVNDLTEDDCNSLFFLTDFEKQSLLYYISHNAPLFSIYELQFVLGLPLEKAQFLSYFFFVLPMSEKRSLDDLIAGGKHIFASTTTFTNIDKDEYQDYYHYVGGASKSVVRYRFQSYNSLFWGVTMKKDMGETFSLPSGFDSQSFYLQMKNRGVVSNFALGDYKISIAQGLTIAQGGSLGNTFDQTSGVTSNLLSKHSSTSEYLFSRGCGATFRLKQLQLTPFVSFRKLDGKIKDDETFPFTIQKTGYHRTISELNAKESIDYSLYGIHLQYVANHLQVGSAWLQHRFSLGNQFSALTNMTVFYTYFRRKIRLYGECAVDGNFDFATIHGAQYSATDNVQLSNAFRLYQSEYDSFMSSAVGKQSSIGNEKGMTTNFRIQMGSHTILYCTNDLFLVPAKTAEKNTQKGNTMKMKLLYKTYYGLSAYYQLSRTMQTDDSLGVTTKRTHTLYASAPINKSLQVKLSVRLSSQSGEYGVLIYEDFVWKPLSQLTFSARFAQFDASYDNRLYAWEDDVQYVFSNSQYYYAGTYWYVIAKWKCLQNMSLQMKIAQTRYSDVFSLPESYSLYPDQRKLRGNILIQIVL